ncbi:MAG: ABC transporter substrate-binding protein [Solirubrobacteraceae bacterium]
MFGESTGLTARRGATLLIAAVVAMVIAGCGSSSTPGKGAGSTSLSSFYTGWTPGGTPVRGGTATIDGPEAPNTLNPFTLTVGPQPLYEIFDQLVELMPGSNSHPVLEPALATSWTISPDHLIYTFHIRTGVRFSNGESLTGEDVAFSLQQAKAPTNVFYSYSKLWTKIELTGPMTVRLQLSKPEPALLEVLDFASMGIVPKRVYQREGAKAFGLHPVGTGPFMLQSASAGFTTIKLVRNPYYWRAGQPYLNGLVYNQVESDNARILAVRSGTATIAENIAYQQVASLKQTPGARMLVGPEWGGSVNVFNREKAPFNDVNVRKALLYATPREQIIKSVYDGLGNPANSYLGVLKYYNPNVPLYPYDIAKAKELLKSSSAPNGFDMTIGVSSGEAQGELIAPILQSSWAKIGVHATIQSIPVSTLYTNCFAGKFQFDLLPTEGGYSAEYLPDPTASYEADNPQPCFGPPPTNAGVAAKLNAVLNSTNEKMREKLWRELQYDLYWTEPMGLPLVSLVSLTLVNDSVRGFQVEPSTFMRMDQVWLHS